MRFSLLQSSQYYVRSLYRAICRSLRGIPADCVSPPESLEKAAKPGPATQNPAENHRQLLAELKFLVREKFEVSNPAAKDHVWHTRLSEGHSLVLALDAVRDTPSQESWSRLLGMLATEQASQLRKNQWKAQRERHRDEIQLGRLREFDSLLAKRAVSALLRKRKETKQPSLSAALWKLYRKSRAESEANSAEVTRNYLKRLQTMGKIPNPYKLTYMPEGTFNAATELPDSLQIIPGSTKKAIMEKAYDTNYIESIIKPEIEYKINEKHILEPLEKRVNEQGPFKVTLRTTEAGVMPAHFFRLPYNEPRARKELAMDIKRLMRAYRKQFIWNLSSYKAKEVSEKRFGEGYGVRGSGGLTTDEIMFPRSYHEKLALDEAYWEALVEQKRSKESADVLQNVLERAFSAAAESWLAPLDWATAAIDAEVHLYYAKYAVGKHSEVWEKLVAHQGEQNVLYNATVEKYRQVLASMEKDKVFLHSDLYHHRNDGWPGVDEIVAHDANSKEKKGIPENANAGSGKALGDYLQAAGLRSYKSGMRFAKRLNIV